MTKTQRDTIKTNADNLVVPGAVLTAVGGASLIVAGVLWRAGVKAEENDYCNNNECESSSPGNWFTPAPGLGFFMNGITFFCVGDAALVTGVVLLSVGLSKRKKMERNKLAFDIRTRRGKVTLEPTFAAGENGGVFGLVGRF